MSRIGKKPITVPDKVEVSVAAGVVTVTGPKGTLTQDIPHGVAVEVTDGEVAVTRATDRPQHRALHGLVRSLVSNMITGVSDGFEKRLEIIGVGYRFNQSGAAVDLSAGFSHPVKLDPPAGVEYVVEGQNALIVKGIDKQKVGQAAAQVRSLRPPEPYKGKGIRYSDEYVRRKIGKRAQ